jgi:5-methylcytosine-specific restriction endonuclease McrA
MRKDLTKEKVIKICSEAISMAQAASELGVHFNTLKKVAKKFGCYTPNQGMKGGKKPTNPKVDLNEILDGKHPTFQTFKLKMRLIKEGIFKNECSICTTSEWMGKPLMIELDHIDGNSRNHMLENLRMLCPNCHSQTETFRSKKRN